MCCGLRRIAFRFTGIVTASVAFRPLGHSQASVCPPLFTLRSISFMHGVFQDAVAMRLTIESTVYHALNDGTRIKASEAS